MITKKLIKFALLFFLIGLTAVSYTHLFRNHFHIRTFVESVYNHVGILFLRIRETEHDGTLCGSKLG